MSDRSLTDIAVIPTSSALHPSIKDEAESYLEEKGISVSYLADPYENYGKVDHLFSAQSAEVRRDALLSYLNDPKAELLLAARGGGGAHDILNPCFQEKLQSVLKGIASEKEGKKRVLCGFSDFTVLLLALSPFQDLTLIHGPTLLGFRAEVDSAVKDAQLKSLNSLFEGETELIPPAELAVVHNAKAVEGELTGGNLSIVCALLGTPYEVDTKDKILVLEEVGEVPHKIHRNLLHLHHAGKFSSLKGVLLGEFLKCDHKNGKEPSVKRVFEQFFENLDVPVYATNSVGHGKVNRSLPFYRKVWLSEDGLHLCGALF